MSSDLLERSFNMLSRATSLYDIATSLYDIASLEVLLGLSRCWAKAKVIKTFLKSFLLFVYNIFYLFGW